MDRTSAHDLAIGIIDDCIDYGKWPTRSLDSLIERALDVDDAFSAAAATRALFSVVVERLADLFEPQLCDVYARLFSRVIARVLPDFDADDLLLRYNRIRRVQPFLGGEIERVFVLSRVTLGADVAVTSCVLAAAKERFPSAEIVLVGPAKNAELFAADTRVQTVAANYGRASSLRDRLLAAAELRSIVDSAASIVIDPDSRLTQLGLIPICDDSRYYFFESRAFGGTSDLSLPQLTAVWLQEVFNVEHARPYISPAPVAQTYDCCVSWGVGENEDKRVSDEFEYQIVAELLHLGLTVLIDRGAGGLEGDRIDALAAKLNTPRLTVHEGSYASFASHISRGWLYVGYDSAGQHVASATNVPLVSIFAGFPHERMYQRWRPTGSKAIALRAPDYPELSQLLSAAKSAIASLTQ